MAVLEWEDIKTSNELFLKLQATVITEGVGFMVTNIRSPDGSPFTGQEAMEYLQREHPDATEIIIRDPNPPVKTVWSRYPWKVEGSSNPYL